MEEKLDRVLATMVTNEAMEKMTAKVEGRLKTVEKNQSEFKKTQTKLLSRIEKLEKESAKSNGNAYRCG